MAFLGWGRRAAAWRPGSFTVISVDNYLEERPGGSLRVSAPANKPHGGDRLLIGAFPALQVNDLPRIADATRPRLPRKRHFLDNRRTCC
jgi:hypothetical protein